MPRLSRNGLRRDAASGKQQYNTNWCTSISLHTVPTHPVYIYIYIYACIEQGCTDTYRISGQYGDFCQYRLVSI